MLEPADAWIMRLSGDGDVLWQRQYGGADLMRSDSLYAIHGTDDGGFIAAGATEAFGVGQQDAWVLKVDGGGEVADCAAIGSGSPGFTVSDTNAVITDSTASKVPTDAGVAPSTAVVTVSQAFRRDVCNPEPLVHVARTGQTSSYFPGDDGAIQAGVPWPSPRFADNGDGTITDLLTGLMWLKDGNCAGTVDYDPYPDDWPESEEMPWELTFDFVDGINDGTRDIFPCAGYTATHTDWRVPNIHELESLAHYGASNPAAWLNGQGFVNVEPSEYWSSTAIPRYGQRWIMDLNSGLLQFRQTSVLEFLWPVRGGAGPFPDPTYPVNIPRTGQTRSYQEGDDGDLQRGVAWPSPRFTDHGDGTVTDNLTGLMWLKDIGCLGSWKMELALEEIGLFNTNPAGFDCIEYTANYDDWYLPNRREMHSVFGLAKTKTSAGSDALPNDHPFVNTGGNLWTSTVYAHNAPVRAWFYYIGTAEAKTYQTVWDRQVWPVRGGLYAPPSRNVDVDRDGDVDGVDLVLLQGALGANRDDGDANYDERVDFFADGVIDGADLAAFAPHLGRTNCPCMP